MIGSVIVVGAGTVGMISARVENMITQTEADVAATSLAIGLILSYGWQMRKIWGTTMNHPDEAVQEENMNS